MPSDSAVILDRDELALERRERHRHRRSRTVVRWEWEMDDDELVYLGINAAGRVVSSGTVTAWLFRPRETLEEYVERSTDEQGDYYDEGAPFAPVPVEVWHWRARDARWRRWDDAEIAAEAERTIAVLEQRRLRIRRYRYYSIDHAPQAQAPRPRAPAAG